MMPQRKGPATHKLYYPNYSWDRESLAKRVRMCTGKFQLAILDLIRQRTEGRKRDEGVEFWEWTDRIVWTDVAKSWGCTPEALRKESRDAVERGLWETREDKNGVNLRPRFENWDRVKDYCPLKLVSNDSATASADPEAAEDAEKRAASREVVPEFQLRDGKPSRRHKFEVAPAELQITVLGGAATVSGIRRGLALNLTVRVSALKTNGLRSEHGTVVPCGHLPAAKIPGSLLVESAEVSALKTKGLRSEHGTVVPYGHLPAAAKIPDPLLVESAAVQLAQEIAPLGPLLPTEAAQAIIRTLAGVPGAPAAVEALYLDELRTKKTALERKGGKLETGMCIKLAREMPEKWKLREKTGPPKTRDSEMRRLMEVV